MALQYPHHHLLLSRQASSQEGNEEELPDWNFSKVERKWIRKMHPSGFFFPFLWSPSVPFLLPATPPQPPACTTEWMRQSKERGRETASHDSNLIKILTAPMKMKQERPVVSRPKPFSCWHFLSTLLHSGRDFTLLIILTCIQKTLLPPWTQIAASLLEPKPAVRWISPRPPKPHSFYYHVSSF